MRAWQLSYWEGDFSMHIFEEFWVPFGWLLGRQAYCVDDTYLLNCRSRIELDSF